MTNDPSDAGGRGESRPPVYPGMMIVLCTFSGPEVARAVGTEIVADGLAACVNLLPGVESIYRWEAKIQQEQEVLAIFKVKSEGFITLKNALNERHPYEVPEIVGIHTDVVSEKYLEWVRASG